MADGSDAPYTPETSNVMVIYHDEETQARRQRGEPGFTFERRTKAPALDELQTLVGGYIEMHHVDVFSPGVTHQVILNEDGMSLDLPMNTAATRMLAGKLRMGGGYARGTVVFVSGLLID